jgi:hypothetical protein
MEEEDREPTTNDSQLYLNIARVIEEEIEHAREFGFTCFEAMESVADRLRRIADPVIYTPSPTERNR